MWVSVATQLGMMLLVEAFCFAQLQPFFFWKERGLVCEENLHRVAVLSQSPVFPGGKEPAKTHRTALLPLSVLALVVHSRC